MAAELFAIGRLQVDGAGCGRVVGEDNEMLTLAGNRAAGEGFDFRFGVHALTSAMVEPVHASRQFGVAMDFGDGLALGGEFVFDALSSAVVSAALNHGIGRVLAEGSERRVLDLRQEEGGTGVKMGKTEWFHTIGMGVLECWLDPRGPGAAGTGGCGNNSLATDGRGCVVCIATSGVLGRPRFLVEGLCPAARPPIATL